MLFEFNASLSYDLVIALPIIIVHMAGSYPVGVLFKKLHLVILIFIRE